MKLTRAAIKQGLESVPIETILLGAPAAKKQLTPKQRKFAEGIAMGKSKAGAYRDAYNTKAKPEHQSLEGQRLYAHPLVAQQIAALQVAEEARKHATPAALRALVIERLTLHAIDDNIQPAQRLRALELLGKVTEVAAFTERREVVTHSDSRAIRERLIESLRASLTADATDAGASLLAELSAADTAGEIVDVQARAVDSESPAGRLENENLAETSTDTPAPQNPGRDSAGH